MDGSCYAVVIHEPQSSYKIIQVNEFVCLCAGNKNSFNGLIDPIINPRIFCNIVTLYIKFVLCNIASETRYRRNKPFWSHLTQVKLINYCEIFIAENCV